MNLIEEKKRRKYMTLSFYIPNNFAIFPIVRICVADNFHTVQLVIAKITCLNSNEIRVCY